jgi:hypothetical protein
MDGKLLKGQRDKRVMLKRVSALSASQYRLANTKGLNIKKIHTAQY